ncbi:hypothetical protein Ga0466249_005228 [Sporomusaceae bacterium BoRhaA]|nr:hypothetical protein [Pelorhabdus rhamnosifermentans]
MDVMSTAYFIFLNAAAEPDAFALSCGYHFA